jgi:hypothetical protein
MTEPIRRQVTPTNPNVTKSLAFILDGEVQVVMGTDDRHAAVFLSNPTVVEFVRSAENNPQVGYKWDGKNFTPPVSE